MKQSFDIRPWIKPVLTCVLGLVLVFRPGSLTVTIARLIGVIIALVGAGKLIRFFREAKVSKDFWSLAGSVILLVLGFSILRNPVSLEKQAMRVIGILLILQAVRGYVDPMASHEQVTSTLLVIAGAVLLLMPLAVSRLVVIVCGIVVCAIGIGMVLDLVHGGPLTPPNGDDIIDARDTK